MLIVIMLVYVGLFDIMCLCLLLFDEVVVYFDEVCCVVLFVCLCDGLV